MKYLKQFGIIIIISFIGELMNMFIPLSIPASIWGLDTYDSYALKLHIIKARRCQRNRKVTYRNYADYVYSSSGWFG